MERQIDYFETCAEAYEAAVKLGEHGLTGSCQRCGPVNTDMGARGAWLYETWDERLIHRGGIMSRAESRLFWESLGV